MLPQPPPPGQGPVDPRGAFSTPPMPGMYPPMMMPMPFPPPPKKERSFSRAIFTTLATTIFGISLVANIYLLFLSGFIGNDESLTQSTVQHGNAEEKIAVIPIEGVIYGGTAEAVGKWLQM